LPSAHFKEHDQGVGRRGGEAAAERAKLQAMLDLAKANDARRGQGAVRIDMAAMAGVGNAIAAGAGKGDKASGRSPLVVTLKEQQPADVTTLVTTSGLAPATRH
jgi:hypothetical protein